MNRQQSLGGGAHGFIPLKGKNSFTLAEVLITLGIIGVVAAMTMPTLIKKHQQWVLVTRLQKNYSIVSQALITSVSENGDFKEWDLGTDYTKANLKRVVDTYFVPYFKKLEIYDGAGTNSYHNYGFYLTDGTLVTFELDGSSNLGYSPNSIGILFDFTNDKANSTALAATKDYSRKNFMMRFHSMRNFSFFSWGKCGDTWCSNPSEIKREDLINHPVYGCNANIPKNKRLNCGALIMFDGWQIKDDYPW